MPDADAGVTPNRSANALVLTGSLVAVLERVDGLRVVLDRRRPKRIGFLVDCHRRLW